MNPKHAPAMSTIPDKSRKIHSADIVEVLKSIKQLEQLKAYVQDVEAKLKQSTKSSI